MLYRELPVSFLASDWRVSFPALIDLVDLASPLRRPEPPLYTSERLCANWCIAIRVPGPRFMHLLHQSHSETCRKAPLLASVPLHRSFSDNIDRKQGLPVCTSVNLGQNRSELQVEQRDETKMKRN